MLDWKPLLPIDPVHVIATARANHTAPSAFEKYGYHEVEVHWILSKDESLAVPTEGGKAS